MRLDRFLKLSRIIKRRNVAREIITNKRIKVNEKIAKPSTNVNVDDIIAITFGSYLVRIKILRINESTSKEEAINLYEVLSREEL